MVLDVLAWYKSTSGKATAREEEQHKIGFFSRPHTHTSLVALAAP